jgi:hypothetical protein
MTEPVPHEVAELDWHYGPTEWDREPHHMWHRGCPAGRGEVMYDKDGSAFCLGCGAYQEPEGERPAGSEETTG